MYCQHCGKKVNIDENKLLDNYKEYKVSIDKEISALSGKETLTDEERVHLEDLKNEQKEFLSDSDYLAKALDPNVENAYVCPRCNHLIKSNLKENDLKELSQACHAELHRAKNKFSSGMVFFMIGVILTCISFLFYSMSFKATNNNQLVTNCVEFYVFIGLLVIGLVLLFGGITYILLGVTKNKEYKNLLKDIQNETFVQ